MDSETASPGEEPAGDKRPAGSDPVAVLDRLSEVVFETDPVGNWTYLNQAWATVTGFSVAETLGNNFLSYLHPDERVGTLELFSTVIAGKADYCHHETRYLTADGGYRWMELRATVLRGSNGEIVGNVGTILDITARRQAQDTLVEQSRILELIARDAPLPETLGSLAAMLAHHLDGLVSVATYPQRSSRLAWCDRGNDRATGQSLGGGPPTALTAIGQPHGTVEDTLSPTVLASLAAAADLPRSDVEIRVPRTGEVLGLFELYDVAEGTTTDVQRNLIERCTKLAAIAIERDQWHRSLTHQARHDPVTGLPNRAAIREHLDAALARQDDTDGAVAVMFIDLDRFKAVNDSLGHAAGDLLLVRFAGRLSNLVRPDDFVGHFGADGFIVI
ncbi:MAG: diguanylate cyclase, partial [Actinomycetota bacterium]|nr:diguanylate cyclase [Actinomycetota bacterium]